jgi:hypothetical protein
MPGTDPAIIVLTLRQLTTNNGSFALTHNPPPFQVV